MSRFAFFTRPAFRGIWLGLCCALLAWLLARTGTFRGLEDWMLDGCFFYRGARPTQAHVVIVGLDDESLARLKKPLPYVSPELARVVRHVHDQGATAIGIDLLVPESMSGLPEIDTDRGLGDAAPLGQAIYDAGNVVLPEWRDGQHRQRPLYQWQIKALDPEKAAATDFGFVNLTEDGDQFVRRQQLLIRDPDRHTAVPHFSLALFARAQGADFTWDDDRQELRVGNQVVPLDADQKLRINFAGPPGSFPVLPFHQVLDAARENRPLPELRGAIVIIGVTAGGQQDYHPTPYANYYARYLSAQEPGQMAGPEIHAHIIATLHDRAYITTPIWLTPLPLLLLFGGGLGWAFARLRLEIGFLLALAHHFAWKAAALFAFSAAHWRLEVVGMVLLGFLAYAATFALRWRSLRRTFGVVKSEAVALALEADPRRLDQGGEEREVTVLFADIRNFTDFAESHQPHEVVALLNAYFTAIVPAIEAERGTLNTYMGDGIMVLFGAPATDPDHALRAVRAGVAMLRRVHDLKETWARLGFPGMRVGVGIHTGKVVVGAIGSPQRLDYTAVGDTVNAAARIEAENKRLGSEMLIGAATYAALPEAERASLGCTGPPEPAQVKGKQEVLNLYPVAVA
jgi:adenylate cyclase